jgi:putative Ca2+/H+ antiporter (TMEM165/GDT1 family)
VSATVFGIVFLAEWGDLTQIATASLATNGEALSVWVGASLAMITVAGIGAAAGQALLRVLPERLLHRIAAVIFGVLALVFLISAI